MNPSPPSGHSASGHTGLPASSPPAGGDAPALAPVVPLRGAGAFTALLSGRPVSRSEHFAIYHCRPEELSTSQVPAPGQAVDAAALRVGYVIPKRFARRAVTRVAVRRQMREAMRRHGAALGPGVWGLRLRAPLSSQAFRSATSVPLVAAVRAELDALLQAAGRPGSGRRGP